MTDTFSAFAPVAVAKSAVSRAYELPVTKTLPSDHGCVEIQTIRLPMSRISAGEKATTRMGEMIEQIWIRKTSSDSE